MNTQALVLAAIRSGQSPFIVDRPASSVIAVLRAMKRWALVELGPNGWREVDDERPGPHRRAPARAR